MIVAFTMKLLLLLLLSCILTGYNTVSSIEEVYNIDDSTGYGRRFDGVGGLSGGGVIFYL